jgi:N-acetylglucosamine-6-phosphate deacetylase
MSTFGSGVIEVLKGRSLDRARVPGYPDVQQVQIDEQGQIASIRPMAEASCDPGHQGMDLNGDWLSLGGIDLQINGALGLAFPEIRSRDTPKLQAICQFLWEQGVDGFLPTVVTTAVENIHRAMAAIAQFQPSADPTAEILGIHLEGPFLNPQKRGAHPAEFLQPLTLAAVHQVLGSYADWVTILTLAPELEPTGTVIASLHQQHITVSLGHSLATADQAQAAFAQGATMVTHAFNAMPSLHHRQPGLLAAALLQPGVWCGVIADGQHVDPLMLKLLFQASQGRELFLVSDALSPLGLPDGVYPWDQRQIEVQAGTARLRDGTLAGTTVPLLVGVQNLVRWDVCSVTEAISLATEAPRQAIGLPGIGPGQPASKLLRWHQDSQTGELSWCRVGV